MSKTKEALTWFKSAQDDLTASRVIVEKKAPAWVACFHCQQAAEKALKAAQIYFLADFQKEHDLEVLLCSLKRIIDVNPISKDAAELTDFYVATRYPGIKESELTIEDAILAIKSAQKILDFVKKQIR